MFIKFKELKTQDEQLHSPDLADHAHKVMSTLDEGIQGLDNVDIFLDFFQQVGASHSKIVGFRKEFFWVSSFESNYI